MNTFDPYTRSVIIESLQLEAAEEKDSQLPPKNPKKGQRYIDKYGRIFTWTGSNWQRATTPQSKKQSQGGVGFQGDVLPPPIQIKSEGGKETIVPAPREAILYGQSQVPSGYDPEMQAALYNYYQRASKALEGVTMAGLSSFFGTGIGKGTEYTGKALQRAGDVLDFVGFGKTSRGGKGFFGDMLSGAGKGLEYVGKGMTGAINWALNTGPGQLLTPAAEFAAKQAIRSGLAYAYLGLPNPKAGTEEDYVTAKMQDILKSQLPKMPGITDEEDNAGILGQGRFGPAGQAIAERIPKLAAMGYDPMEYVLNKFGAQEASKSIANSAAKEAEQTLSAGGWLRRGRELGAFK